MALARHMERALQSVALTNPCRKLYTEEKKLVLAVHEAWESLKGWKDTTEDAYRWCNRFLYKTGEDCKLKEIPELCELLPSKTMELLKLQESCGGLSGQRTVRRVVARPTNFLGAVVMPKANESEREEERNRGLSNRKGVPAQDLAI